MVENGIQPRAGLMFGVANVLAPALLLASAIAMFISGEGQNRGEVGGILNVWGFMAYAVAVVGLTRALAARRSGMAATLLVTALVGTGGGVGYGIDAIQASIFDNASIQETDSIAGPLVLQLPGILFPISLLVIAILLVQSGALASWPAYLLGLGAILFPIGNVFEIEPIAIAADAVLLVAGLGLWGRLTMTPDIAPPTLRQ